MNRQGHLNLIIGPMFSDKTTELIMRVKKQIVKGKTYQAFKLNIDNRYGEDIVSHDGLRLPAVTVSSIGEIISLTKETTDVVCIDEVQFYESEIIKICKQFANSGKIVIVSGLDKDFRDEFFPFKDGKANMSYMIQAADEITRLHAICNFKLSPNLICGKSASRTQKFVNGKIAPYDTETIQVGNDKETEERKVSYTARCRWHFQFYNQTDD